MVALTVGDPAPWFIAPTPTNPHYHFSSVGGYRSVLCFFGTTSDRQLAALVSEFCAHQDQFAALNVPFFGVSVDPNDTHLASQIKNPTYCKFFWDFDRAVSQRYGVCASSATNFSYTPTTFVLNENLQIIGIFPVQREGQHVQQVFAFLASLPPQEEPRMAERQAPVLLIPNVLERSLCQHLIDLYEADGGSDSGFMRQVDGKTVEILDPDFKKRRDYLIQEKELLEQINARILRRVRPEIEKAFQFSITRFERHLVACYEASDRGFFNRHRDNTTKGTVHRRFAMSLNLNTGEYEGGCLRFPEFGQHLYRPDTGEAIIFSCSLLHEATPVTAGRRFALLSFFYNDEDAKIREQNMKYVELRHNGSPQATAPTTVSAPTPLPKRTQKPAKLGFQPKTKSKRK